MVLMQYWGVANVLLMYKSIMNLQCSILKLLQLLQIKSFATTFSLIQRVQPQRWFMGTLPMPVTCLCFSNFFSQKKIFSTMSQRFRNYWKTLLKVWLILTWRKKHNGARKQHLYLYPVWIAYSESKSSGENIQCLHKAKIRAVSKRKGKKSFIKSKLSDYSAWFSV